MGWQGSMQTYEDCVLPVQAVTRNELYGYLHPATREWKEGLMSVTYRDMANNRTNKHQWIVLDGDIDAEWIEVSSCQFSAVSLVQSAVIKTGKWSDRTGNIKLA